MSGIDVRDLAKDKLAQGRFPADPHADFRLFLAPDVHRGIWEHGRQDTTVEICGVLVGHWERDENGPYAVVTDFIRCEQAASKLAEVTFTHESWAQINHEMDTKFADARIIGWYHSHPDFGIFLSERDCFIHEHFFSSPGQIAYVVDPVREQEGVFAWRNGKPEPLPHYWVGDVIRTVEASRANPAAGRSGHGHMAPSDLDQEAGRRGDRDSSTLGLATMMLAWVALFLLGYLYGGLRTRWVQQMIVEGTVAHYGVFKLMKLNLEENLAKVRSGMAQTTEVVAQLPDSTEGLSEDEVEKVVRQRKLVVNNLRLLERALAQIQEVYGMSPQEREVYLNLVAQKQAELRKLMESAEKQSSAAEKPTEGETKAAAGSEGGEQ